MTANEYIKVRFGRHMNQCTNEEISIGLLEYVKDRADKDGVLIAGTYIQYFLDNQINLHLLIDASSR